MNLPTLIVAAIVAAVFVAVICIQIRDRKNGKCSCGGSCGSCAMSGSCHAPKNCK